MTEEANLSGQVSKIAERWIYQTAHKGPKHLCNGIAGDVVALYADALERVEREKDETNAQRCKLADRALEQAQRAQAAEAQVEALRKESEDALAASARANVLRFAAEAELGETKAVLREMFVDGPVQVAFAGNPIACEKLEARARAALSVPAEEKDRHGQLIVRFDGTNADEVAAAEAASLDACQHRACEGCDNDPSCNPAKAEESSSKAVADLTDEAIAEFFPSDDPAFIRRDFAALMAKSGYRVVPALESSAGAPEIDLEALEAIAHGATAGPWSESIHVGKPRYIIEAPDQDRLAPVAVMTGGVEGTEAQAAKDSRFVATFDPPMILKLISALRAPATPAKARSASPWLDICDARHDDGVVLIRFQSGECCAAYLTERLPPLVQTWRYAFAPCRGQQAPWPVAWMPIPKAETDHG